MVFLKTKLKILNKPHVTTPKHSLRDHQYLWQQETSSLQYLFLSCALKLVSFPAPWGRGLEKKTNNPQTDSLAERVLNQHHTDVSRHLVYQSRECFSSFSWHPSPCSIYESKSSTLHLCRDSAAHPENQKLLKTQVLEPWSCLTILWRFWKCYLSSVKVKRSWAGVSIAIMVGDMHTHVLTRALGC